mgnify:CR=1 FL=1
MRLVFDVIQSRDDHWGMAIVLEPDKKQGTPASQAKESSAATV